MIKSENEKGAKKKSRATVILKRILLVILGIILGLNIYLLNAKYIGGNEMPMAFGIGTAVVQSGSMEPAYYKGDLLFVKEKKDYAVGDVVVYQTEGMMVVHRIMEINGNTVITKGDANNTYDEAFDSKYIKGYVAAGIPKFGYVIDFLKKPAVLILIIAFALILLGVSFKREPEASESDEDAQRIERLKEEIEVLKQQIEDLEIDDIDIEKIDINDMKNEETGTNVMKIKEMDINDMNAGGTENNKKIKEIEVIRK